MVKGKILFGSKMPTSLIMKNDLNDGGKYYDNL